MLDEVEYASDTDESDEDYSPDADGGNAPSEVESDGEPENDNDTDLKRKSKKRATSRASPVITKRSKQSEEVASKTIEKDELSDDEDENEDALWASFLGTSGQTATKPESNTKQKEINSNKTPTSTSNGNTSKVPTKVKAPIIPDRAEKKKVVTEIFEFAGEKVEVQKEITVMDEKPATSDDRKSEESNVDEKANKSTSISAFNRPRSGGGLSSVLGQLGKKNKLSVLEKSKIDWSGFKRNEGIDEELQTHNKGRDGYLERQDFLQRTDLRQFEIEKNMRQATRRK